MKIKSSAIGIILASTMVLAVGPAQAACHYYGPGWHMVSKSCQIKPATTWREYNSGVYLQPQTGRGGLLPMLNF